MSPSTPAVAASASASSFAPEPAPKPTINPAIQNCIQAHTLKRNRMIVTGADSYNAGHSANKAYLEALPHLTNRQNILDFIACVTYGLLIDAVSPVSFPAYLQAAQAALKACDKDPAEPRPVGRPRSRSAPDAATHPASEPAPKTQPATQSTPVPPATETAARLEIAEIN